MVIIVRMSLEALLARWRSDARTGANISAQVNLPPRPADLRPMPEAVPAALVDSLRALGISALYSHQQAAWDVVRAGHNLVLATGTASGKTLAYDLPVLSALLEQPRARALYLFPTKALAQDQWNTLSHLQPSSVTSAIYDGDTPASHRKAIRENTRLLLSNPDMLHTGILPHHTNWRDFFTHLRFVVIDEMHTYRGVFGSHVANVLRRLRRVARFYGAAPQFILASATIGNPAELAEKLIAAPVQLVDVDGSARGARHFLLYNPPVIDRAIGLRKSSMLESVRLAQDVYRAGLQQVVFARTRRSVEMILKYLQQDLAGSEPEAGDGKPAETIRGYRSGYLPTQRRGIERGLRDGSVRTVVATNALELGIDIGGLQVALLSGYPGTIASARQQAGRAGRGLEPAAAVLVASANPIDQFLARHPDYFFERSPEQALIAPDHLLILLQHLRCAMFELPFARGETFGGNPVDEYLEFMVANQEAHLSNDSFYWMADAYPAAELSLRTASPESYLLLAQEDSAPGTRRQQAPRTVGIVDAGSALWMVHPGAVYLHEGQQYHVESLDLEKKIAHLRPFESDHFTEPLNQRSVQVLAVNQQEVMFEPGGARLTHSRGWGELMVTTRVVAYRKLRWMTRENLGEVPLDLPASDLQTTGYWLSIADETIERLSREGLWTNAPNDYGPGWARLREGIRQRDGFRCQVCGRTETTRQHDVHHKVPFRMFRDEHGRSLPELANQPDNLTTLCPECHQKVELNLRVRSGLAGLAFVLGNLAPLFLMCDPGDLGTHLEPVPSQSFPQPSVVLFDLVPAGIGFSQKLYEMHAGLLQKGLELVSACACEDGCPSCVGPGGENGLGGKQETLALMRMLGA